MAKVEDTIRVPVKFVGGLGGPLHSGEVMAANYTNGELTLAT